MRTARWRAPGRVNLIGEHTDYNGGYVLPFAVPWGVTATVTRRDDGRIEVFSAQRPGERATDPEPGSGWAAYAAGVLWAMREAGHRVGGVTIVLDSDLPEGAGLSSSAALECAVAGAVNELFGLGLDRPELARIAQRAENDFAGAPTGILDQSASLLCRAGHALLLDTRDLRSRQVPFPGRVLIVDTGVRHALTDGRYGLRRRECESAAEALGVTALRHATDAELVEDPVLRRRARHVVTENARVLKAVALLESAAHAPPGGPVKIESGDVDGIGPLLTASHASLRDDYEVSWPEADVAVAAAIDAGALGARMVGGGFGGSVIALVKDRAQAVHGVTEAFAARGWNAPRFRIAVPSEGAVRLRVD